MWVEIDTISYLHVDGLMYSGRCPIRGVRAQAGWQTQWIGAMHSIRQTPKSHFQLQYK